MIRFRATVAALAIGITICFAAPAAAENVLRWASDVGALTLDPHSAKHGPSTIQRDQIYERLLHTSASLEIVPQLAVAWRPVGPLTWEFELREGVRFHDGRPFTAEDVVFSIERARSEPSQFAGELADISASRAVDSQTVSITTRAPDALLPDRLRLVFIMSKAWAEEHGVTRAADFKAGEERPMRRATLTAPAPSFWKPSSRAEGSSRDAIRTGGGTSATRSTSTVSSSLRSPPRRSVSRPC